jgi:hypothetical protein|tara:strand:+ start:2090 stop:2305 length:216 start_codon:yes stop_codon:yes gene_type:complete
VLPQSLERPFEPLNREEVALLCFVLCVDAEEEEEEEEEERDVFFGFFGDIEASFLLPGSAHLSLRDTFHWG